jgi:hypothetical protein
VLLRRRILAAAEPSKHKATIRVKLTKSGRALLKRGRSLEAILRLTSFNALGKGSARSIAVTLRG